MEMLLPPVCGVDVTGASLDWHPTNHLRALVTTSVTSPFAAKGEGKQSSKVRER